jgi:hypothetical protein
VGKTFREFAESAMLQETEITDGDYWNLEKEYWNYVENQTGSSRTVEYAADINTNENGSGFGNKSQKIVN